MGGIGKKKPGVTILSAFPLEQFQYDNPVDKGCEYQTSGMNGMQFLM